MFGNNAKAKNVSKAVNGVLIYYQEIVPNSSLRDDNMRTSSDQTLWPALTRRIIAGIRESY